MNSKVSNNEKVIHYHDRTKHHYRKFAASLGYMDWSTQPDAFRRYEGCQLTQLPIPHEDRTGLYNQLFTTEVTANPVCLESLSEFFYYSLAISAWKSFQGHKWALRVNPSSGNLHPTEGYLVISPTNGLSSEYGIYHYAPKEHGLELRANLSREKWEILMQDFPKNSFLIGVSSIYWREVWKYGERGFRYCQHDVGHVLACLRISAAIQGWKFRLLDNISDNNLESFLGFDRNNEFHQDEKESPDFLAIVTTAEYKNLETLHFTLSSNYHKWYGKANTLSDDHHKWEIIDDIANASKKQNEDNFSHLSNMKASSVTYKKNNLKTKMKFTAAQIIRQRRSAVAMDGSTSVSINDFYKILSRTIPNISRVPWDSTIWPCYLHLGIFVHRVNDLSAGIYALVRDESKLKKIQAYMKSEFLWAKPDNCPKQLPFYLLEEKDVKQLASRLSCGQDIAGDGAFSLGMLAEFESTINEIGPFWYKRLFWESGMIGQILYLEAESIGISSTGIGCFFDDPVHEVFGIKDKKMQSLYHFTIGGAVDDARLTTLPAY